MIQPREQLGESRELCLHLFLFFQVVSVEQDVRPTWEEEGLPSVANMDVSAVGKELLSKSRLLPPLKRPAVEGVGCSGVRGLVGTWLLSPKVWGGCLSPQGAHLTGYFWM